MSATADGSRVVRAACPHDCPDTCAMLVTVDGAGRAVKVAGDPTHPVTAGFLCGKVSNYLDRVYADDRILHPLVREGPKGEGPFRRASWDEALDLVGARLRAVIDRLGGEAVLPYSYLGTMGVLQNDSMSARFMNAIGASGLERTICASAGVAGVTATHGLSPEVDPEEWPHARYVLAWGWNPLSTAPHLWRLILAARRSGAKLVVVDPYRSRTARVADEHVRPLPGTDGALALGLMRAIADAGLADETWCRAHAVGYDELLARLEEYPVERCATICDVDPETIARLGRELATTQPSLVRLGVGAQRHYGAPLGYRTIACLPALAGSWRHRGGGLSYVPTATAAALDPSVLRGEDLRPGPVRTINMAQLGRALTDPGLDPPVAALVVWNANPAAIAPDQERVLAGLRREDLGDLPPARGAPRPRRSALPGDGRGPARRPLPERRARRRLPRAPPRAGLGEDRPRPGARAARGGRLPDAERQARAPRGRPRRTRSRPASPLPPSRRGRRRGARPPLPALPADAEDAPLPELDVREPAPPGRGAAEALRRPAPGRRRSAHGRGR